MLRTALNEILLHNLVHHTTQNYTLYCIALTSLYTVFYHTTHHNTVYFSLHLHCSMLGIMQRRGALKLTLPPSWWDTAKDFIQNTPLLATFSPTLARNFHYNKLINLKILSFFSSFLVFWILTSKWFVEKMWLFIFCKMRCCPQSTLFVTSVKYNFLPLFSFSRQMCEYHWCFGSHIYWGMKGEGGGGNFEYQLWPIWQSFAILLPLFYDSVQNKCDINCGCVIFYFAKMNGAKWKYLSKQSPFVTFDDAFVELCMHLLVDY